MTPPSDYSFFVIPAKAGIHRAIHSDLWNRDFRLRGNDGDSEAT